MVQAESGIFLRLGHDVSGEGGEKYCYFLKKCVTKKTRVRRWRHSRLADKDSRAIVLDWSKKAASDDAARQKSQFGKRPQDDANP
ncbi:hypothetical protein [Desulfovibrio sp. ZJ200]|uniref:hypothetical protein n=1 Tax=Desulfovibrio sp. ZJ200 TaxID=2709792 RepID=UPI0019803491|nr:hypothetical protein [Desulfovibrio sp. ZJ200]